MFTYLNGAYIEKDSAFICVDDRGFRFGDGLFETVAILGGTPHLLDAHLARLHEGMSALRFPKLDAPYHTIIDELITRNHVVDGVARIIITRGSGSIGYLPTSTTPTCYIEAHPQAIALAAANPPPPIHIRPSIYARIGSDCLPSFAKMTNAMNLILARMEAEDYGVADTLLCTSEGIIAETSSGNLLWRQGDRYFTPCTSTGCVSGTMRQHLMRQLPIIPIRAPLIRLEHADAVVMTNALNGVIPITRCGDAYHFPYSSAWAKELWEYARTQSAII
ncbi:MAG: hypothetical protein EAY76_00830 [Alphaproteobacteria bacterium]|nr:MAG: hypothetical protein EAY76_00830 [Alphaproteobacteria bacterium]TAF76929.1 MAG: hypothetical protein EAZ52_02070 [Alphaproteobacteria bacterium]